MIGIACAMSLGHAPVVGGLWIETVPGLLGYFDAPLSNLYADTGLSTPADYRGDVGGWAPSVGTLGPFRQTDSLYQPSNDVEDGVDFLSFDGNADRMTVDFSASTPLTIAAKVRIEEGGSSIYGNLWHALNDNFGLLLYRDGTTTGSQLGARSAAAGSPLSFTPVNSFVGTWQSIVVEYGGNGGNVSVYTSEGESFSEAYGSNLTTTGLMIGHTAAALFKLARISIIEGLLGESNRTRLLQFMQNGQ